MESVSLALIGAALGVGIAHGILAALARSPLDMPRADQIHVDGAVLAFTATVAIATGLVFGWLPSLRCSRPDLDVLREQGA